MTKVVRSKNVAGQYCMVEKTNGIVAPDLLLHRVDLRGKLPNEDTSYFAGGGPTVPSFNFRKLLMYWPLAIPMAVIAWFFNRRGRLKSSALIELEKDESTSQERLN